MALETATYISGLVAANPLSSDPKSQGDDHLRLIKITLLNTFPNISGAVIATHTELNYVSGVTSGIQSQLNAITAQLSGVSIALHQVTAATSTATIGNANNAINWNWSLKSAAGKGLSVSESSASTSGSGSQDLVSISTVTGSTANPLRVRSGGVDAIVVGYKGDIGIFATGTVDGVNGTNMILRGAAGTGSGGTGGNISISSGAASGTGGSGSVSISTGDTYSFNGAGAINLIAGNASSGSGGDIKLQPGTGGSTAGRVNFVNSNVANGTVASAFTASVGPTGASTSIVGWLAIKVGGTARYIPYW